MTEEQAMKWARSTASALAISADDGDKLAKADLQMMALSYAQGWWARDRQVQIGVERARSRVPGIVERLKSRLLAADGREC